MWYNYFAILLKYDEREIFVQQQKDEMIIAGRNSVNEALKGDREIECLLAAKGAQGPVGAIIAKAKEKKIPIRYIPKQKLDERVNGVNHQGVALVMCAANYSDIDDIVSDGDSSLVIILDKIEDPHNLGAIIRTADAAGAHGVIIPKRGGAGLSSTVAKVACGACEHVKVARVPNISAAIDKLKSCGYWIYGADMDGENCFNTRLSGKVGLVICSEGFGISRIVKEKCDFIVSIPMCGEINSLNASVAAGILMYKAVADRD